MKKTYGGLLLAVLLLLPSLALAGEHPTLPEKVETAVDALLADVAGDPFDPDSVTPLLDLLPFLSPAQAAQTVLRSRLEAEGAVQTFALNVPLERIVRSYDPDLPINFCMPDMVRLSGWRQGGLMEDGRRLFEVTDLSSPAVARGVEFTDSTPGEEGASYAYDMLRMTALFQHRGDRVLVSVTKQKDVSTVGRKSLAVDRGNWVFFYSGLDGLNRAGVSWADSYIYDSASINLFVERAVQPGRTLVLCLKWLKAGWRGFNMVGREDLLAGQDRFAASLRRTFEGRWVPLDQLADLQRSIMALPDEVVDGWTNRYAQAFAAAASGAKDMGKKQYSEIVADGGYAAVLDQPNRRALLGLESLKCLLGKPALADPCAGDIPGLILGSPLPAP
ncbi:MAG: hypothetical protein KKB70_11225 [Proteobacteria bacterium]|nr:hypothetical protein [Pseudomonadota bacterium]MBU1610724.1 hypothetical protein [Pseudomonadota bacterium]